MIDLSKMCDALAQQITAAGHWFYVEDGILVVSDEKAVSAIVDAWTLADAIGNRKAEVSAYAKQLRDKYLSGVSVYEVASWSVKLAEAKTAGTAQEDTLTLAKEAQARGIPLVDLVAKVKANSAAFNDTEAQIAGVEGKHKDVIASLRTFEEVAAYDFTTGWPG